MVPGTPPGSETQNARDVPFLLSEIKIKGTVPLFLSFIFRCQVRDGEGQGQDTEIDNFFFFLVERKVCFILEAGNLGAGSYPKADSPPPATPSDEQWTRAFIDRGRGLHAETAQLALAVMLTLVIGGLISVILIVLSTVNLQFQDQFVSISLRPVLGTVAAYVMATVRSSCS